MAQASCLVPMSARRPTCPTNEEEPAGASQALIGQRYVPLRCGHPNCGLCRGLFSQSGPRPDCRSTSRLRGTAAPSTGQEAVAQPSPVRTPGHGAGG